MHLSSLGNLADFLSMSTFLWDKQIFQAKISIFQSYFPLKAAEKAQRLHTGVGNLHDTSVLKFA
jgi:hypothetical protein